MNYLTALSRQPFFYVSIMLFGLLVRWVGGTPSWAWIGGIIFGFTWASWRRADTKKEDVGMVEPVTGPQETP